MSIGLVHSLDVVECAQQRCFTQIAADSADGVQEALIVALHCKPAFRELHSNFSDVNRVNLQLLHQSAHFVQIARQPVDELRIRICGQNFPIFVARLLIVPVQLGFLVCTILLHNLMQVAQIGVLQVHFFKHFGVHTVFCNQILLELQ